MKLKTLRIKIENDNQTFELSDFFEGNTTLYDKFTHIVDEPDGKYWHVMIFYTSDYTAFSKPKIPKTEIPKELIIEIHEFIKINPPISKKVLNNINANIESLIDIESTEDFKRFRSLGAKTLAKESVFLNGILEIIKKYRKKV